MLTVTFKNGRTEQRTTLVGLDWSQVQEVEGLGKTHTSRILQGAM